MTVTSLDLDDLDALRADATPLLLDVRTPAEYDGARLRDSVNVPLDDIKRDHALASQAATAAGAADPARPTVVVCQSGRRASEAAGLLDAAGVPDVRVLDGGLAAWRAAGREVVTGAGAWEMERQVRLVAGSIVLTSILASTVAPRAKWLAGGIGTGLTVAALTDTCTMAAVLAKAPWNTRTARRRVTLAEAYGA